MKGINPTIKSSKPAIRIASRFSNFTKSRPFRIDKNVPELRANQLLHIKVITLTLLHCSAIQNRRLFVNKIMVGSARFERATSASQTQNHTKLDHDPNKSNEQPNLSFTDFQKTYLKNQFCEIVRKYQYYRFTIFKNQKRSIVKNLLIKIKDGC